MTKSVSLMSETIKELIINMFSGNPMLATFIIAMLPIFELRGAIPFGMSTQIWGNIALSPVVSFLTSFLATSLVVPIITLIFIPLLNALKRSLWFNRLASKFEERIKTKSDKIKTKGTGTLKKMLGVGLFVAIPLPLTGVYTGTCIAVMLGLNFYETLISVVAGNLIAGLIMLGISTIFKNNSLLVIAIFIILLVIFILINLTKKLIQKLRSKIKSPD